MTERLPPPDLTLFPSLRLEHTRILEPQHLLGRIHFTSGDYPATWSSFRSFGPTQSRFDHHPPPRQVHPVRAVLYAAPVVQDVAGQTVPPLDTCLAEVFRDTGVVDVQLNSPYFTLFRLERRVTLLDLTDSNWVTVAGANAALTSGPRGRAREWARAIYRHYGPENLDGMLYGSSNMPRGRSVVLFESARYSLPSQPAFSRPLADASLHRDLQRACLDLGLDLL